jgi:hypothetical protein
MSRTTDPIQVGDNALASQPAGVTQDYQNPVLSGFIRIPFSGQTILAYKLPSYAIIMQAWVDLSTVYSSGAVNIGTTSNGTEIATFATLTATGRLQPTLTAAQITASKAAALGAGQVPLYISPSSTVGAGVGEVVLHVCYANFKRAD